MQLNLPEHKHPHTPFQKNRKKYLQGVSLCILLLLLRNPSGLGVWEPDISQNTNICIMYQTKKSLPPIPNKNLRIGNTYNNTVKSFMLKNGNGFKIINICNIFSNS